jgi:hypothetical protein
MRLSEIRRGSPIEQHYATCENCSRVAADLQYAERKLALALSDLGSSMPPSVVAQDAIAGAARLRRRNAAKWFRRGLFAFGALILGTYVMEKRIIPEGPEIETEMVILKCTTPDVATSVVTPYLRSNGSAVYRGDNARFITLRGAHREVESAISHLDEFESRFCGLPAPTASPDVVPSDTYLEFQVEKPVAQIPGTGSPRYPDALRSSGVEGEVQAQFVVGQDGRADVGTFKALKASHDLFTSAVRSALPNMRFYPAQLGGKKVKQLVQQSFQFKLDR